MCQGFSLFFLRFFASYFVGQISHLQHKGWVLAYLKSYTWKLCQATSFCVYSRCKIANISIKTNLIFQMYRKHMMEKEEAIAEEMFLTRVGELPVVTSALGQVKDMYTWTKERNGLLKYTLEAGEGAVCSVSGKALPVVSSKLQGSGGWIFFTRSTLHSSTIPACLTGKMIPWRIINYEL